MKILPKNRILTNPMKKIGYNND
ncbi:hypothetical protein BLA29_004413 [Euroglyphus maynei]|uniref:Uncharacterized protein n=1 Tax=Euroglyphus maynei TaxID=6958 RepID=A0A1Y3BLF0_EURMA|nr:hypothetical protein BLA29_004413 [Euroglyphus maynei]